MIDVSSLIGEELEQVETALIKCLSSEVPLINRAGGYIIGSGGKRFRPAMLLLVAKYCNYQGVDHIPLACVFEYIHTATLLHDDVLDHAKVRRGNSSVNSVWGDKTSVLVGDFLLSKAFSILVKMGKMKIMGIVSDATTHVAEGETMQTERGGDVELSEKEYINIVTNKTASLISAACQVGAILGSATPRTEEIFKKYGLNLGIAFQIVDDALDYVADDQKFGKTPCKDLQEGKVTLPLIHTLRVATGKDRKIILEYFNNSSPEAPNGRVIIDLINKYQGVAYVYEKAREYISSSLHFLQELDESPIKDALSDTAEYIVERRW